MVIAGCTKSRNTFKVGPALYGDGGTTCGLIARHCPSPPLGEPPSTQYDFEATKFVPETLGYITGISETLGYIERLFLQCRVQLTRCLNGWKL
jgi:hypothetical protein